MGKLVIRCRGKIVGEVNLKLGETKIGRRAGDIVLDDPAVSSAHAVIRTVGSASTIYDLNSTNGTFVEKQRIQKHDLADGQTIVIGEHSMLYRDELGVGIPAALGTADNGDSSTTMMIQFAHLIGIDGPAKGKRVSLTKETSILENPGKSPIQIVRTSKGYILEIEEGSGEVVLNGHPISVGQFLENGDVIEVGGTKFQLYTK